MNEIILLVLLLFLGRVINSKRLERFIFFKTLAVFAAMLFFSTTVIWTFVNQPIYRNTIWKVPLYDNLYANFGFRSHFIFSSQ
ncbi:hypothetical protein U1299_05050 [Enterococcus cecorum]|uniref:Uncharacterized protein n=1 Tax=Enterococcus cecorum TaxID=44008 RepID=A0AAW9JUJ4_9ENTE|nr:hypothetical protein [Enterococcus cecorum]MDZ5503518.1 hypothetical protein [Enterococcus cecorum]MDZ5530949.1 hypothetical protein [Enterococcus cecorum]MDZ5544287.1 hypothetical protein [Enterococcus cecorum]MDZ5548713.1 hypothetical protein [Enterococcus cecorum]MDZ5551781.1 hypothetical protein [Enterococcus cecorum]